MIFWKNCRTWQKKKGLKNSHSKEGRDNDVSILIRKEQDFEKEFFFKKSNKNIFWIFDMPHTLVVLDHDEQLPVVSFDEDN